VLTIFLTIAGVNGVFKISHLRSTFDEYRIAIQLGAFSGYSLSLGQDGDCPASQWWLIREFEFWCIFNAK
jgi:hypothetical protein